MSAPPQDPRDTEPSEPAAPGAEPAPSSAAPLLAVGAPTDPGAPRSEPPAPAAAARPPVRRAPPSTGHPGVAASIDRPDAQADPWGFLVRALAYETLVVLMTAVTVASLAFMASLLLFQGELLDVYLRLRGGAPVSGEVALLTIGPEALYLYDPDDPAPETTPRALLAELVRFLDAADASVIALDFLLDRPAEGDEALARAAEAHGAVIAAERFTITEPAARRAFTPGIPPALELVMGSGLANFQEETAGLWGDELVVRRIPLVHGTDRAHLTGAWPHNQLGAKQDIDQVVPSLALAAAWAHRERQAGRPGRTDGLVRELALGCTARPLGCDLAEGVLGLDLGAVDLSAPTDINFRGPETGDGLVTVDAARVLRVLAQAALMRELGADAAIEVPPDLRARLEGRVVVVGRVSPEGGDRFLTPYSMPFGATPDMSGPRIHAHVIDTLLSGRHVRRASGLWMWALAAATALAVSATYGRTRDTIHAVAWLLGTVGLLFLGFAVFRATDGLVLDLGPAVAGVLLPLTWLHLRGWVREQAGLAL